ncbi:hypothetical protein PPECC9_39580 [Escherichia coli PCN009]|nr:hypothetical protein SF274771_3984 [Shigella flexneri 2747-71]EGJ94963.1 hypothetical protein SF293071_3908 [Shigella flexneri 2930-71]KDV77189.1 hypothetical protein AD25_4406 [Escherichia coli 2-052-05_S4_C3]OAF90079.1 hypothetical protein PPECC9_39580 [Escherichia coli PCN009]
MYVLFNLDLERASTKAGNSKITHSGDSQPPAMREKSTMFLWNK